MMKLKKKTNVLEAGISHKNDLNYFVENIWSTHF